MFFVKLLLVTAAVVTVMVAVKDGRILAEAGLKGTCVATASSAAHGEWGYACSEGRLTGRPDMSRHDCTSRGVQGTYELWGCPAQLASDRFTG